MSTRENNTYSLGLTVGARTIRGVLLRSTPDGAELVRRFTRQRAVAGAVDGASLPGVGGQFAESDEGEDYSVQFGEGGSSDALFLDSEFGEAGDSGSFSDGDYSGSFGDANQPSLFSLSLADILSECRDAGYDDAHMAFCLPPDDVERVVLTIEAEEDPARPRLLRALKDAKDGGASFDAKRVAFLPMTPTPDGQTRYLALMPSAAEPIVPTLQLMQNEQRRNLPPVEFIDSELAVYLALARVALSSSPSPQPSPRGGEGVSPEAEIETTLVVRAGDEDTLAAFLQGDRLHHVENLHSLTAFDASETICSRVLLLQDEYGIGDLDHVLVVSEQDEDELVDAFETFFPDANVRSMQDVLPIDDDAAERPSAAAMGVALRMSGDQRYANAFEKVNMLAPGVLKRKVRMPVAWTSIGVLALLFLTVLFFTWTFASNEQAIAEERRALSDFTTEMAQLNPQQLQADIDSMNAAATSIVAALEVLDNLLTGSDTWSRTLAQTSRQVGAVGGIWVESWAPSPGTLLLQGNATSRSHVVGLAQRLRANIMSLSFSEIREWPVYSFTMKVPLPDKLPEAAEYLRARAAAVDSMDVGAARTASYRP